MFPNMIFSCMPESFDKIQLTVELWVKYGKVCRNCLGRGDQAKIEEDRVGVWVAGRRGLGWTLIPPDFWGSFEAPRYNYALLVSVRGLECYGNTTF